SCAARTAGEAARELGDEQWSEVEQADVAQRRHQQRRYGDPSVARQLTAVVAQCQQHGRLASGRTAAQHIRVIADFGPSHRSPSNAPPSTQPVDAAAWTRSRRSNIRTGRLSFSYGHDSNTAHTGTASIRAQRRAAGASAP